jgi:hypothetical protein
MKTIQLTLTEKEAKALICWLGNTSGEMERIALWHSDSCRIGRYIDNSQPNLFREYHVLGLNIAATLKGKL